MDGLQVNIRIRVLKGKVLHIRKVLPSIRGKANVVVGQEVFPGDVLGIGQTQVGFRTIHLTSELGVEPGKVALHLKPKLGQTVFQGELLAEKRDLLGRKKPITSPVDGVVDFIDEGKGNLRLKLIPKPAKLISGVSGVVDFVDEARGEIVIRTLADIVFGVLGAGREREGILKVAGQAGDLVSSKQITEGLRGLVIVGGGMVLPEAFQKAAACGVAGIISGGINAGDFKAMAGNFLGIKSQTWSDVGLSVLMTEGFGAIPIGEDIFPLLKQHDGKYAFLDGHQKRLILPIVDQSSMICIRKTRLPALPASGQVEQPEEQINLKVGMKVRITSGTQIGFQGVVETIDRSLTELPSGIRSFLVGVLGKRQKIRVSYQNLEVVG